MEFWPTTISMTAKLDPASAERLLAEADPDCMHCHGTGLAIWSDASCGIGGPAAQVVTRGPCRCTTTWLDRFEASWQPEQDLASG